MIAENFISNLTAKFRSKEEDENRIFFSDLSSFVDACKPDALQDIYNAITREHTFQTIPRMGKFWKIAEKGKFLKLKEQKAAIYWNICKSCGAVYSKQGRGCPRCRSTASLLQTGEMLPDNIIDVQEDCFYCTIYPESIKRSNERKQFFQGCGDYGIKQDAKCSICLCKECCTQMMKYNSDPKGTTEQYKSTELAQPWIVEVQPLNQTVSEMIQDMARRR